MLVFWSGEKFIGYFASSFELKVRALKTAQRISENNTFSNGKNVTLGDRNVFEQFFFFEKFASV